MKRPKRYLPFVIIGALLLGWAGGEVVGQDSESETADQERTVPTRNVRPGRGAEVVYTTDYLRERFDDEQSDAPPAVYTNHSLKEREDDPAKTPPAAFTNEDLTQRFGAEQPVEERPTEGEEEVPVGRETDEEPVAEPAEPAMSAEERELRISEIDAELERLEKRLLAIRNPLLAGTAPATGEEALAQAGLDNAERLRRTEAKMDELRKAVVELREGTDTPPDE